MSVRVADYIARAGLSTLSAYANDPPWRWTRDAAEIVGTLIAACDSSFGIIDDIAIHETANIEAGAQIKGPAIIGPHCFVARTALIRGGCWLDEKCIIGPGAELKTSFLFAGSKLAHLNFVGDSVLGENVNIEAGAMIANYRNELADKRVRIKHDGTAIDTGVDKFGALVGDNARIGANAVIAPGAILPKGAVVPRLGLVDQA
jgi:NDP-sugar pyrophosphorylase family protein